MLYQLSSTVTSSKTGKIKKLSRMVKLKKKRAVLYPSGQRISETDEWMKKTGPNIGWSIGRSSGGAYSNSRKIITYFQIPLQEPPEPLPVERSTGFFDSQSAAFQTTLLISGTLLISCILCGIIWDIIRHIRERTKIKPQGR